MILFICRLLFRLLGWKITTPANLDIRKAVVVAAPHTSNWDAVFGLAYYDILGIPVRFTIKHNFMKFPYSLIFGSIGGIAIDRRPKEKGGEKKSMTEAMVDLFNGRDQLNLMVTPEATRSKVTKWKTGFYYVALNAKVPILLGYLDYKKKEAGMGKIIYPSGDIKKDMKEIMDFYRPVTAKHPEKFSLDLEYA